MRITSVTRNRKRQKMLSVFIDNKFSFCIPEDIYLKLGLYEERELTEDEIDEIKKVIIHSRVRELAVKYIQTRIRSVNEVRMKLKSEGFDKETVENVLKELIALGYLNDRLFAQKYIYDRKKLKPKSKLMLKHELMTKGINEEIADDVLSEWKIDDEKVAESLVRKKFGKYDLNEEKNLKRVYYFLKHRGYNYETIKKVILKAGGRVEI